MKIFRVFIICALLTAAFPWHSISEASVKMPGAESSLYRDALEAYKKQEMPAPERMPEIPEFDPQPSRSYRSVTMKTLQGRWVNRYTEGGVDFTEILTVNGGRGSIETWQNGVKKGVWNGEGTCSIEDRSDRKVCPAFRITDDSGNNICTIYIRWVEDDRFYDGGFLCWWQRETPEDPWEQYGYRTVTLENLQGLWYAEHYDSAGQYQVLLNIDGDRGWIFETVGGRISSTWNGEGTVSLEMTEFRPGVSFPELLLRKDGSRDSGGTAGIYISFAEDDRFYDAGFHRWYIKLRGSDRNLDSVKR